MQDLGLEDVGVKLNKQGAVEVLFCLILFVKIVFLESETALCPYA